MRLTEEEIARRAGTTPERVRELVELGVIGGSSDPHEPFRSGDVLRVQLVEELAAFGITPARVATALAEGALTLSYLDKLPAAPPRTEGTHAEVCDELGVPFELLARIYAGFGLPRPLPDDPVREDDLEIISGLPILFEAGLGEEEVLRAARVWGEGPRRVAEHQVRSFHDLIEEPFRRQGLSDDQALDAALSQVGVRLIPYCQQLVFWLYQRHFETYATEHRVGHIEAALDAAGLHRKPGARPEAVAFADLSGYTRLTDELGDAAAERIALRLAELMQEVATRNDGLVVKMLGDGVHVHFSDPARAIAASLEVVERAEPLGLPPAHVGVNAGPMSYVDGDYYGFTVILAARIAAQAGPGQVLVGEAAAEEAPAGVRFEEVEPVPLKGVARPVTIFRAVRDEFAAPVPSNCKENERGRDT
ncbi:MAG TPA: adenylate cyclase regulatory domain-containing protein [Gaiellaceae bacterium]|nr:adenylate cyclase regulatory domain-containing protein [Gaiellaceae bacterium]